MTTILVKIWAYDHYGQFTVTCEDNSASLEKAILDKLGEKSIVWEYLGISYDDKINRITYEEVVDGRRPVQTKKVLGAEVAVGV